MAKEKLPDLSNEVDRLMTPQAKKELEPILTATFQQFLIRYLDLRDNVISNQMAETLKPMLTVLEKISDHQDVMTKEISDIKTDITHMKCDIIGIRQQVKSVRDNYERLEIRQLHISEKVDEIDARTQANKMWRLRIILVIVAAALALGLFIWLFPWIHKLRMVALLSWI